MGCATKGEAGRPTKGTIPQSIAKQVSLTEMKIRRSTEILCTKIEQWVVCIVCTTWIIVSGTGALPSSQSNFAEEST